MSEPIVIGKAPGTIQEDYEFDWVDAATDDIVTSSWTVPAGITKVTDSIKADGTATLITLSGGTDATNYTLVNEVTYTSGQTDSRTIILEIRARAAAISLIVATVGASTANSYVSLATADAYFANRLSSDDWFDAETVDRERALIMATTRLEGYDYVGEIVDDTTPQALKWPRQIDDETLIRTYAVNAIPAPVTAATCELALSLLSSGGSTAVAGAVESMKIGSSVEIKYASGSGVVDTSIDSVALPIGVARLLAGLRLQTVLG